MDPIKCSLPIEIPYARFEVFMVVRFQVVMLVPFIGPTFNYISRV